MIPREEEEGLVLLVGKDAQSRSGAQKANFTTSQHGWTIKRQISCGLWDASGHLNGSVQLLFLSRQRDPGEGSWPVRTWFGFLIGKMRKLTRFISQISFNGNVCVFVDTLKSLQGKSSLLRSKQNRLFGAHFVLKRSTANHKAREHKTANFISFGLPDKDEHITETCAKHAAQTLSRIALIYFQLPGQMRQPPKCHRLWVCKSI